ncbi:hypothetical protein E2C01_073322 [Portunus trituberculatus]|uniref:Uncharacterized protein n=1 Tax=Portunus trituberculatus TaxID=210409 RepID=A0A5B7IDN8_PORTR|nr:hypothetical protein [Portunus trituberculatus]
MERLCSDLRVMTHLTWDQVPAQETLSSLSTMPKSVPEREKKISSVF